MIPQSLESSHALAADKTRWRDLLRDHFVSLDVTHAGGEVRGEVASHRVGHLQMSTVTAVDQEIGRGPDLVRRDDDAYLQIGMIRSGRALVEQDGRRAMLGPGDFVIYETARPFDWSLRSGGRRPTWELAVFTWPRSSFGLSESRSRDITACRFDSSMGMPRVVSDLLCGLITEQPTLSNVSATAFADQVGDLLSIALSEQRGDAPQTVHREILMVVDEFIDEHLSDPDLNPEMVARAVAISTRQLHRLFLGREMTVAQTIRARRLEGARREILANLSRDRSIREIALNWGYLDLAVFGRAFRQMHGVSPRQYRARECERSGDLRAVTRRRR